MVTKETVLQKVRKLLALADPERGGTEAERDLAYKRAQELLFKHGIAMLDVDQAERADGVIQGEETVSGITSQWKGMLLFYVASANFVSTIKIKRSRSVTTWVLVGQPENVEFVRALTQSLIPWLTIEANAEVKRNQPYNPKAFKRAFFDAAGRRIRARLVAQQRDFTQEAGGKGTELVRVHDAANRAYMEKHWPQLRKGRSTKYSNLAGKMTGAVAGERADLTVGRKLRAESRKALGKGA